MEYENQASSSSKSNNQRSMEEPLIQVFWLSVEWIKTPIVMTNPSDELLLCGCPVQERSPRLEKFSENIKNSHALPW